MTDTTYRAVPTIWDDGRNTDGSPRTRTVWTIEGPKPFGGLTAKDEAHAREVVATLNGQPIQVVLRRHADVVAETAGRLNRSTSSLFDLGARQHATIEIAGDLSAAQETCDRFGCSMPLGRKIPLAVALDWVAMPAVDRERLTTESPERYPDAKQTAVIIEAVLRDAATHGTRVCLWTADGNSYQGLVRADPDGERMFAAFDGIPFEAWWCDVRPDASDDVRIVQVEVLS